MTLEMQAILLYKTRVRVMTVGFLAVPRGVLSQGPDAWFPGDRRLASIYVALVEKAFFKDATALLPGQATALKKGQCSIGTISFAEEFKVGRQVIRTSLAALTRMKKVNHYGIRYGNQSYTVVTIIDYEELYCFHPREQPQEKPQEEPLDNHKATTRQPPKNKGTREQGNKGSPLSPPKGEQTSERKRRALATDQADALTAAAVGARRNCLAAPEAERMMGHDGWRLLLFKFGDWQGFSRAYETATQRKPNGGSDQVPFEAQLKASFRALLLQAPADPRPVRLVPKDRAT